jgi:hypothetical protein
MTVDHLSPRTLRRLAKSPYAPLNLGEPMLRTDVLARLLVERLVSLGPLTEAEAVDVLNARAPGRGAEVVRWSRQAGLVRRVAGKNDEPDTLEALGAPRSLAA